MTYPKIPYRNSPAARLTLFEGERDVYGRRAISRGGLLRMNVMLPRAIGAVRLGFEIRSDSRPGVIAGDFTFVRREGEFELYTASVGLKVAAGLYFVRFYASNLHGEIDGDFDPRKDEISFAGVRRDMRLLVYEFAHEEPKDVRGSIIYHIFVDRFCKSGKSKLGDDAILNEDWDGGIPCYAPYPGAPLKNNVFFGGDLYGIASKLDYLSSLGVGFIYLSPIFEAYSNHKYDTGDYMKVDEGFGGDDALRELISEAKARGIGIIADGVFNHTGDDSVYFDKYGRYGGHGAYSDPSSKYFSWYEFTDYPDEYESWWGIGILPRIHPDRPECGEFFTGADGVVGKYMKMGLRGIRLDVADELSDDFIRKIKDSMCRVDPRSVLYGEVWEDASCKISYGRRREYFYGSELDGVMNYPLMNGILSYVRYGDTDALEYALLDVGRNCPKRICDMQMNFLCTHDTERAITRLVAPAPDGKSNDELARFRLSRDQYELGRRRLMCAYLALATLPGVPSIFYGDEAGLYGYGDPFNRMPFPWSSRDRELTDFYARTNRFRIENEIYRSGELRIMRLDRELFVFSRETEHRACVTIVNRSEKRISLGVCAEVDAFFGEEPKNGSLDLPPLGFSVLRMSRGESKITYGGPCCEKYTES